MWNEIFGGLFFVVYVVYSGTTLYSATTPPICDGGEDCVNNALKKGDSYNLYVWLDSRTSFDTSVAKHATLGSILKPRSKTAVLVGAAHSSYGEETECGATTILFGNAFESSRSYWLRFWKKKECRFALKAAIPDTWNNNSTRIILTAIATGSDKPTTALMNPITTSLSLMYKPEKRKRQTRLLLQPNVRTKESNTDPYMALPTKTRVGPLIVHEALSENRLRELNLHHLVHKKQFIPQLLMDTNESPRDEYTPQVPLDGLNSKTEEVLIYLTNKSWRKHSLENIMINAMSKLEDSFGASQYDSDSLKLLFAGISPEILMLTFGVSVLHMVFEFLAMASAWSFFKDACKDEGRASGLSSRAILLDACLEIMILMWLYEEGEALLVQVLLAVKIVFNLWRYKKLRKVQEEKEVSVVSRWTLFLDAKPFDALKPTQLAIQRAKLKPSDFELWSLMCHSSLLLPIFLAWVAYQIVFVPQKNWLSLTLKMGAHLAYAGGFIAMTPQLYKNYYYRSVESLPWVSLTYNFLNTIIDDLFSFLIRMPKEHRISVFRDDVIFVIYWLQKLHYQRIEKN